MRVLRWLAGGALAIVLAVAIAGLWAWNDRPDLEATGLPVAGSDAGAVGVRVTWLGVTTLLFDDGETRILTDGFFSRPGLLDLVLDRPVTPDAAGIDAALAGAGIERLAAVIPLHSHYDHAMDSAEVARRTGALVLGSSSTANAARGAGLPEERIVVVEDGESRGFGRFRLTFVRSRHAPLVDGGPPFPGTIDEALVPPAPVSAWREGGSWTLLVAHPSGTALVQGSAGFVEGSLAGVRADVALLGIGGLARLGRPYAESYWREIVDRTGARRVLPIHHDDLVADYGEVRPAPRLLDDLEQSLGWLAELAATGPIPVRLERLPVGKAVALF